MTKEELMSKGYNMYVAEALHEMCVAEETLQLMSAHDVIDMVLSYNGIIGYTHHIIDAVDNIRNMEHR